MAVLLNNEVMEALKPLPEGLTFIVTVGNRLRGDDGAGPLLSDLLEGAVNDKLLVLNAGDRPEDSVFECERIKPARVILIDAANFGGLPGEARVISANDIAGTTLSTHTFPLPAIARIIQEEMGKETCLIGIQAVHAALGRPMSDEVKETVQAIAGLVMGSYMRPS